MYRFQQRLKNLKQSLKIWNKHTFGDIFASQQHLANRMSEIQRQIRTQGLTSELKEEEQDITQQLAARKKQEEILWKQKSRIRWLKEGDRNTKFFHRTTIQRQHTNRITSLTSANGDPLHSHEDLEAALVGHYQNLLTEPIPDRHEAIAKLTQHVPTLVTREQNLALL